MPLRPSDGLTASVVGGLTGEPPLPCCAYGHRYELTDELRDGMSVCATDPLPDGWRVVSTVPQHPRLRRLRPRRHHPAPRRRPVRGRAAY